jgi:DNA repair protein RadC
MTEKTKTHVFVREVRVNYCGPRRKGPHIQKAVDVKPLLVSLLKDNAREHFIAIYLDGAHRVASYSVVSIGTARHTVVHPREIFQPAILSGACAVIIAHNHPSGDLEPSTEDRWLTEQIVDAGKLLGIPVLDHVIFSEHEIISAAQQGWL